MKVIKTLQENNQFKIEIEYSGEQWKKAFKKEYDSIAKNVKVEGFRPGKAPANIIKKHINVEEVAYKAVYKSTNEILELAKTNNEFLKEKDELFEVPSLELVEFDSEKAIIELKYDVLPSIQNELDYKKINLYETKPEEVSDEEVQKEIDLYQDRNSQLVESKDTELKKGQTAVFDFVGLLNGEEFPGGKAENYELEIGSNQFIPGFEDQMIGLTVGNEKDINVTFPESYHEKSLAGKDVVFKIKLHSIKEKSSAKLDDEAIKELKIPNVENLKQLKEFIKNSLLESIKTSNKELVLKSVMEYSDKNSELSEISQRIIDAETDEYMKSLEEYWQRQGVTLDYLLKALNKNLKEFKEMHHKEVLNKIKTDALIRHIAKKESIKVSDEDYNEEIKKLAKQYNISEEIVKERLEANRTKIMKELLLEKVIDRLFELNKNNERIKVEHHHDDECGCGHDH
ncbi:MAG: trigger factor [Ureaplasma sp.]|nr:trigger factor [Ureaplasma sp.]